MIPTHNRNLIFDTIDQISHLKVLPQVTAAFASAMKKFGFTSLGINGMPPPGEGADLLILTESAPTGFRELYIQDRFYLVDHICEHARSSCEPFRYSEAPYNRSEESRHKRFMQALQAHNLGKGLIVPIGRPLNVPTCVWLGGGSPDLSDDGTLATELITLYAASKAYALACPQAAGQTSKLTAHEREVLQWIAAGKTSWEISVIFGLSERAINKIIGEAMAKLNAVSRAQAVVRAIRSGDVSF